MDLESHGDFVEHTWQADVMSLFLAPDAATVSSD